MKHLKYLCTLFKPADQSKYIGVSALVQKFDGVLCFSFTNRLATVQRTLLAKLKDQKRQWCCFVLLSDTQSCQVKMSTLPLNANPAYLHPQTGNQLVHCQPIKVEIIVFLNSFVCSFLAQLFEPNVRLCGNLLDGVLQLFLDCLPMFGTGHSPSCV